MVAVTEIETAAKARGRTWLEVCAHDQGKDVSAYVDALLACRADGCLPAESLICDTYFSMWGEVDGPIIQVEQEVMDAWVDALIDELRTLPRPSAQRPWREDDSCPVHGLVWH